MPIGRLYKDSEVLVPQVWLAEKMLQRMRGLLFRKPLVSGEGMLIRPCSSIHTIGMTHPLDVVFVDAKGIVLKLSRNLRPLRMDFAARAHATLELSVGEIDRAGIRIGDQLRWQVV